MTEIAPWLLGHASVLQSARSKCETAGFLPRVFEVLDPDSRKFFALLNATNQVAFGGLGMPAWVQLDCCTLPGLMVGWGGTPTMLSKALKDQVQAQLADGFEHDFWPYSEFCGVRRGLDALVGVSTFSLVPRQGLGLRAKALGLWLSEVKTQIGMTQWDNPATALHCKFGALRVIAAQAANHSRPEHTFVYELAVPGPAQLLAMLRGATSAVPPQLEINEGLPMCQAMSTTVQAWLDAGQRVHIVKWTSSEVGFHRSDPGETPAP